LYGEDVRCVTSRRRYRYSRTGAGASSFASASTNCTAESRSESRSARTIAGFDGKWWKSDGCRIPTAAAISLVVVPWYPWRANRFEAS
jgi:hypothetical protein